MIATVARDGRVTVPSDPSARIEIRDDGAVLENEVVSVEILADGKIGGTLITELRGVDARFSGPPESKRAMMLAWIAALFIAEWTKNSPGP